MRQKWKKTNLARKKKQKKTEAKQKVKEEKEMQDYFAAKK